MDARRFAFGAVRTAGSRVSRPGCIFRGVQFRAHNEPAYFGDTETGRFLAWHEGDVAVVLTSSVLPDDELMNVADGMALTP